MSIDSLTAGFFMQLNDDISLEDVERRLHEMSLAEPIAPDGAKAVMEMVNTLPDPQRMALTLHVMGFTSAQIARFQGQSREAVTKTLSSAYARLRLAELDRPGPTKQ